MNTLDLDLELALREDGAPEGSLAFVYGRAVPYDTPTNIGGVEESFARESFDPGDVIGKPLHWRHGEPIGVIVSATNKEDGLYIGAQILDTAQGRDAATLTRAKAVKGLSVGFHPVRSSWDKARTKVQHMAARLAEVSLTPQPAYANAGVSVIREETEPNMSETTIEETPAPVVSADVEAREAIAAVREDLARIQAAVAVSEPQHPLAQYRSLQEYAKALATGQEDRAANVSALSEQTGMVPPVWLTDIKGVLDRGRPCINALGGAMSAGTSGLDIKWPKFTGDLSAIVAQGSEGAEPNSADIDITVGSATLVQYDSYNTLTWQVIDRADPSYVAAHARILMGAYGTETDYAFQTALWANDTSNGTDYAYGSDTDGSGLIAAVWDAATDVEFATGQPAEVVFVAANIWAKLPSWSKFQEQNLPVQNAGGSYNIAGVSARLGGLPVVLARNFATDGTQDVIVTNRAAIGWAEDGPRMVSAEKPSAGGRDVAIYGLGVATPFIPSGIVSIYNTP